MKYIQVIEYKTTNFDEVGKLVDEWVKQTAGRRTASHGYTGRDRDGTNKYMDIITFPSYEDAQKNNELPETHEMAEKMGKLCEGQPVFHNLDVVREDELG